MFTMLADMPFPLVDLVCKRGEGLRTTLTAGAPMNRRPCDVTLTCCSPCDVTISFSSVSPSWFAADSSLYRRLRTVRCAGHGMRCVLISPVYINNRSCLDGTNRRCR